MLKKLKGYKKAKKKVFENAEYVCLMKEEMNRCQVNNSFDDTKYRYELYKPFGAAPGLSNPIKNGKLFHENTISYKKSGNIEIGQFSVFSVPFTLTEDSSISSNARLINFHFSAEEYLKNFEIFIENIKKSDGYVKSSTFEDNFNIYGFIPSTDDFGRSCEKIEKFKLEDFVKVTIQ